MPKPSNPPPESYAPGVGAPRPTPATAAQDRRSLRYLTVAVIIGLAGAVTEDAIDLLPSVQSLVTATSTPSGAVVHLPSPWLWVALLGVGGALAIAEILLIRLSFTGIRPVDSRFSAPASLSLLAVIGILVALVGVALLLNGIYGAVACSGAGRPLTLSCLSRSGFLVGLVTLLVGALVGIIGYIGILIGIWRFGSRHEVSWFKGGVILLIFPLLNVVGAILILLAAQKALERIGRDSSPPLAAVQ